MYLTCNSKPLTDKVHEGEPYGDYITESYKRDGTVLYWRKANAIHKWFVDNVQGGNDDCGTYEVYPEQLSELRDLCKQVLDGCPLVEGKVKSADVWSGTEWVPKYEDGMVLSNSELADELLPTTSGFFFGSTGYDQWYYDDIRWTYRELDRILSIPKRVRDGWMEVLRMNGEPDWNVKFYYHSSW